MQHLSNDTIPWNLILAPPPASLLQESNAYASISPNIDDFTQPAASLVSPQPATISVNYWAFILIIFPLFTIFGNILVVISVYREKSLHTVTNYFVVSLAISDITVAAVVMPFAIYLEFNRVWGLSDRLCDFWVAADCMACTASILNLVAIAVDRYIAVTKPLKYARHKNPKRVAIMIVIVWLISFLIALPIVSGVNISDVADYPRVAQQCAFFNNKFLIFSSLGSFFIPCIIIFAIYYRIFLVIMAQARKTRKQCRPRAVIESAAAQHRSNADNLVTSFYHERQSLVNSVALPVRKTSITSPIEPDESATTRTRSVDFERNSLMLKLSTPISPGCYSPVNRPSSSGEQNEDEERDDVALFVEHDQTNGKQNVEHENEIEILVGNTNNDNEDNAPDVMQFKTKNCSSQTDNDHHDRYSTKRIKSRLKMKMTSDGSAITAAVRTSANNVKVVKRKAYSRMKKNAKPLRHLLSF